MKITSKQILFFLTILLATATSLHLIGRHIWGTPNVAGVWCDTVQSSCNSQFLLDAYSFTHILHGIIFYFIFYLIGKKIVTNIQTKFFLTMAVESIWEIIENTEFIIQRYREATISLDYYGDSIMNSLADIIAAAFGFGLAYWLPTYGTVVVVLIIEAILILWIRDSLVLNIIQLLISSNTIKDWQSQ